MMDRILDPFIDDGMLADRSYVSGETPRFGWPARIAFRAAVFIAAFVGAALEARWTLFPLAFMAGSFILAGHNRAVTYRSGWTTGRRLLMDEWEVILDEDSDPGVLRAQLDVQRIRNLGVLVGSHKEPHRNMTGRELREFRE